ncbi:primosomal protein DnaI [Sporosarcina sp. G11-34]|uniref:primosomal protein DnaI n=1 Tax=Sporosarcina sp. G11-34 TaxID=2849605 RepID=UPI0022A939D1|nr:primosomal protein DnaI [Sporosarcina sp. G11-34]MCZ2258007.1 primosomal protein DnaI [Sporosarcina sp. G11-34]
MERIGDTLNRVVKAPNFAARYEEMRKEIMGNPGVQKFLTAHSSEITSEVIERSLGKLYEYSTASHRCEKCTDLTNCVNIMKGFEPELVLTQGLIDVAYTKCPNKLIDEDERNISRMIESLHMQKDVMQARLPDIDIDYDDSRLDVVIEAKNFLKVFDETGKLPERGIYIHGPFGTGKSYILGALANELAKRRVRTVAVYVPEFLREMKQSIQDQTLNEKIEFVKKAQVLMLDDFGAETMSAWTRDEVLGTVLQYRMAEKLPTFFTSNFSFSELEHHLTYSQRGDKEVMKASRIMERISTISTPIKLEGDNRRDK